MTAKITPFVDHDPSNCVECAKAVADTQRWFKRHHVTTDPWDRPCAYCDSEINGRAYTVGDLGSTKIDPHSLLVLCRKCWLGGIVRADVDRKQAEKRAADEARRQAAREGAHW